MDTYVFTHIKTIHTKHTIIKLKRKVKIVLYNIEIKKSKCFKHLEVLQTFNVEQKRFLKFMKLSKKVFANLCYQK